MKKNKMQMLSCLLALTMLSGCSAHQTQPEATSINQAMLIEKSAQEQESYLVLFGCCVFLAVVLLLTTRNRKGRNWELLRCFAILAASAAVSILLVTSGNLITTGNMASYKWPQMIICESVVLTLTALMWWKLYQTNKAQITGSPIS
ncbi:MAG: hypothetical protein ACI4EH_04340 [Oliverpabstia sp.]